ncbi:MAG: PD40 domain-containing protein [Gemmatimonadota bacterium]|nr:MAG: PD40 domain-containing protein [Gemmatimonadota bacterium]
MKRHRVILVFLPFALVWSTPVYSQQTAEELYQAGLYQEEVQGNLESAIEIYRRILDDFSGNRTVGAKAQLHVGLCYEKLGLQEAQQAYRRVIDEFPEHTDEVAVARDRLAGIERSLAELNRQPSFRKIEIASNPRNGVLSPDGSKLAFISEGAVWVVPLHGRVGPDIAGEPVRLAEVPGVWDTGSLMAWSADGQWIAVNGGSEDEELDAVSVIPAGGGEPRVVHVPDRGGHAWSHRLSLSPDGRKLAISALEPDRREGVPVVFARRVYTIPTAGGEPEHVSPGGARLPAFSPEGQLIAYVGARERDDWRENEERSRYDGDLWVVPSTGGSPVKLATVDGRLRGPVWSPDGRYIAAHYEPGKSNYSDEVWVYPLSPGASNAGEPAKISLPRPSWNMVAGWTPNGELGVFMHSEEHSAIYSVPAQGGKAVQITPGTGWPYYPRWSADGERIYHRGDFDSEERGVTIAYIPAAGGEAVEVPVQWERRLVVIVPGGGLNVSPDGERIVFAAYQDGTDEGGDLWTIPANGGLANRLTTDWLFERHPCWSPDGGTLAFTKWHKISEDEGFFAIYVIPAEGGATRQITSEADNLGGGAITFSPDGQLIAFFSGGAIKTVPIKGGQPEVLVAEVRSRDHSQLAYSPDGSKIAHSAGGKIWITPLDAGVPEELRTGLPEDVRLSEFGWSPDGSKIAFMATRGGEPEFFLISDFLPTSEGR